MGITSSILAQLVIQSFPKPPKLTREPDDGNEFTCFPPPTEEEKQDDWVQYMEFVKNNYKK